MKLFSIGFLLVALLIALSGVVRAQPTLTSGALYNDDNFDNNGDCTECLGLNVSNHPVTFSLYIYLEDGSLCDIDAYDIHHCTQIDDSGYITCTVPPGLVSGGLCFTGGPQYCKITGASSSNVRGTFMWEFGCEQLGAILELH